MSPRFQDYYLPTTQNSKKTRELAQKIIQNIHSLYSKIGRPIKIMHVCGTHEATVARSGIRALLPKGLKVISGPGCPVCVCPAEHIATALQLAREGHTIVTFGDMFKVPDDKLVTLAHAKAQGYDIRLVYSVRDALEIAKNNPKKKIIWLGIGFETTAPMTAYTIINNPPENFYVLSDFRLVPPAMKLLAEDPEFDLDAFILPGHVSTIIGTKPYEEFPQKYGLPSVITGFEPIDFLIGIQKILLQIFNKEAKVENAYARIVKPEGNVKALQAMQEAFKIVDAKWRGIGIIPDSGFELANKYTSKDAKRLLSSPVKVEKDLAKGCLCGKVILGKKQPEQCPHFLKRCTPETPLGPCMVSDEGTCRIHAKYIQA